MLKALSRIAPVCLSLLILACGGRPDAVASPPPAPTGVAPRVRDVEVSVVVYSGGPGPVHQHLTRRCGTGDAVHMGGVALTDARGQVVREARFHSSARLDAGRGDGCEYFATLRAVPVADGYRIFRVLIREEELARGRIRIEVPMR